jgi:hypothetical protein
MHVRSAPQAGLAPVIGSVTARGLALALAHSVGMPATIGDVARSKRGFAKFRPPPLSAGAKLRLATCEIVAIISGIRL